MSDILATTTVANPKLTLLAFHLRNSLAQGDEPVENADYLWEQCQKLGQKLSIPRLETLIKRLKNSNGKIGFSPLNDNPASDYLELLPPNEKGQHLIDFSAIPNGIFLQLRGEVYPLQIHDTYAVDITLRYPYPKVQIAQLNGLNFQECLLPNQIQSSLGQTLILFLQPLEKVENARTFAEACLKHLLSNSESEKLLNYSPSPGKFLGSPIFEYDNGESQPSKHLHILVWLNSDPQTKTLEAEGSYYQHLLNLLCCRSKILYTYNESRWCNNQARLGYQKLEKQLKSIKILPSDKTERLIQLKQWLVEIPEIAFNYACYLRDLEIHRTTIETNAKNYRSWLDKLQDTSLKERDNLDFFAKFLNLTHATFIEQINVDLAYLTPGEKLFEQMINTIRGIVETEQAERDRNLQKTIQAVGFGIGAAGVVATSAPYWIKQEPGVIGINKPLSFSALSTFILIIFLSLSAGLLTWGIASGVMNRKSSKENPDKARMG